MKLLTALFALAVLSPLARAQDAPPLAVTRVAQTGKSVNAFAPPGWKTEKIARGDLNRDGRADAAIVLVEAKAAHVEDGVPMGRRRALVIAFNKGKNWQRVGFSNQLLLGTRDGGALYGGIETPVKVDIEKGVVIVGMESGSREVTVTTHRLRWEPARRVVYVIGMDSSTRDRGDGSVETVSVSYLTGDKKVTTRAAGDEKVKVVNSKVKRAWRWLGAVGEADRYKP